MQYLNPNLFMHLFNFLYFSIFYFKSYRFFILIYQLSIVIITKFVCYWNAKKNQRWLYISKKIFDFNLN